jgi:tetratricopeptide (TPR) repeat protein
MLLCSSARADDASEREARALFAEGLQKMDSGDFVGALDRFRAAYARFPSVNILLDIGTMLGQLGRNAEAADAYDAYLRDPAANPAKRPEVEKLLHDLDARVAKLHVVVDGRAAIVRVDGKVVGQTGGVAQVRREPGSHAVSAESEGAPPAVENVMAVAGQEVNVTLHIVPTVSARDLFENGTALYKQSRWADAEAAFQKAWDLHRSFDLAANLGDCELRVGQNREAAEHLAYALRELPLSTNPTRRERIQQLLAQARALVGALRVRVNVPGADISVDGRAAGVSPLADEVFIDPGPHIVEARLQGYVSVERALDVQAGQAVDVALELAVKQRDVLPAIVMGSLGGAAAVTGVVMIGLAESKHSDAVSLSAQTHHACPVHASAPQGLCAQLASAATLGDTLGNGGIVALVVAGAAAVGVGTYLLWPPALELRVHVKPNVSMNGGSVMLYGDF